MIKKVSYLQLHQILFVGLGITYNLENPKIGKCNVHCTHAR